jgi:hypothetical protein
MIYLANSTVVSQTCACVCCSDVDTNILLLHVTVGNLYESTS